MTDHGVIEAACDGQLLHHMRIGKTLYRNSELTAIGKLSEESLFPLRVINKLTLQYLQGTCSAETLDLWRIGSGSRHWAPALLHSIRY